MKVMIYVLIMTFDSSYGKAVATQEFLSKVACERAKNDLKANRGGSFYANCYPKYIDENH